MNIDTVPIRNCHVATHIFYLCDRCLGLYQELKNWDAVRQQAIDTNLPQVASLASRRRYIGETIYRLKFLTEDEIIAYPSLSSEERLMLLWIALCRGDYLACSFGMTLLNAFVNSGKRVISNDDYKIFYSHLCDECEKFRGKTESSIKKMRGWILNSARQAQLLEAKLEIRRKYPSDKFISLIRAHDVSDLLVLPIRI